MLYREVIAVCSQIHTKHINTLCGQNVELLNIQPGGTHSYHRTVLGYLYRIRPVWLRLCQLQHHTRPDQGGAHSICGPHSAPPSRHVIPEVFHVDPCRTGDPLQHPHQSWPHQAAAEPLSPVVPDRWNASLLLNFYERVQSDSAGVQCADGQRLSKDVQANGCPCVNDDAHQTRHNRQSVGRGLNPVPPLYEANCCLLSLLLFHNLLCLTSPYQRMEFLNWCVDRSQWLWLMWNDNIEP